MSIYSKEIEDAVTEIDNLHASGKMEEFHQQMARAYHSGKGHIWMEAYRIHKTRKVSNVSK